MGNYKAKILVVDDEPDICGVVQEILQDEGYIVFIAKNAEEAREIKNSEYLDLVLLDIWMPDTDGITLLKEWVSDVSFSVPVIMMLIVTISADTLGIFFSS
jgi:DNA-binding response OmpR family regulator